MKSVLSKITFILVLFFNNLLFSNDQINFLRVDFPPLWIIDGPLKQKGIADVAEAFLQKTLNSYTYKYSNVTVARAQYYLSNRLEKTYCAIPHGKGFFKNAQESKVWIAISGHVLTSTKNIISNIKKDKNLLNSNNQLYLEKLLTNKKQYKGLVTKDQKYPIIDSIIKSINAKNIKEVVSKDMLGLHNMVLAKRADFTFQYESTVKYLQKIGFNIDFITIDELNNYKVPIVVGCNNTALARKFLYDVDLNIKDLRKLGLEKIEEYHSKISAKNLKNYIYKE